MKASERHGPKAVSIFDICAGGVDEKDTYFVCPFAFSQRCVLSIGLFRREHASCCFFLFSSFHGVYATRSFPRWRTCVRTVRESMMGGVNFVRVFL